MRRIHLSVPLLTFTLAAATLWACPSPAPPASSPAPTVAPQAPPADAEPPRESPPPQPAPAPPATAPQAHADPPASAAPPDLLPRPGDRASLAVQGARVVPAGTFIMGAQSTDPTAPGYDPAALPDEAPPRQVAISAFRMDVREVKEYDFGRCVASGACKKEDVVSEGGYYNFGQADRSHHPVNGVTWHGAVAYCASVGGRLPTEAEWEYAARGPENRRYASGEADPCDWAHLYGDRAADDASCEAASTLSVYTLDQQSAFGMLGMSGNVAEWVADFYAPDTYASAASSNPHGPATGTQRVIRGGSWTTAKREDFRAAARASAAPDERADDVGFRCAFDIDAPAPAGETTR